MSKTGYEFLTIFIKKKFLTTLPKMLIAYAYKVSFKIKDKAK